MNERQEGRTSERSCHWSGHTELLPAPPLALFQTQCRSLCQPCIFLLPQAEPKEPGTGKAPQNQVLQLQKGRGAKKEGRHLSLQLQNPQGRCPHGQPGLTIHTLFLFQSTQSVLGCPEGRRGKGDVCSHLWVERAQSLPTGQLTGSCEDSVGQGPGKSSVRCLALSASYVETTSYTSLQVCLSPLLGTVAQRRKSMGTNMGVYDMD